MASKNGSTIHVLHVDDDPDILEVSKQILVDLNSNFEIDFACSVDEALKKMAAYPYDAVVSDYEMGNKNGLQFLTELRDRNNKIPFILFTGKSREEVAIKALNITVQTDTSTNRALLKLCMENYPMAYYKA